MSTPQKDPLAFMLEGSDLKQFFAKHWNRSPVLVCGEPNRFQELYSADKFWSSDSLTEVDAANKDDSGQHQQFEIPNTEAKAHYDSGHTICASVLLDSNVGAFVQTLCDRLAIPNVGALAKIYASPDGAGFSLHSDAHHVFVLQLEGEKRWNYSEAPFSPSTLFGSKLNRDGACVFTGGRSGEPIVASDGTHLSPPTDLAEVVLRPGDCLYLPPGCWHQASALGSSVGLSISPPRNPGVDVLSRLLRSLLQDNPSFGRDIVAEPGDPGRAAFDVESLFIELQKVVGQVGPNQLANAWAGVAALERGSLRPPAPTNPEAPSRNQRLRRTCAHPMLYVVSPKDERVVCHAGESAFVLPLAALDFVTALATTEGFRAEEVLDWDPELTWTQAQQTLQGLLQSGVIERE